MSYYLSKAGERLRAQIAAAYPDKDTASDGWIGDSSHQASQTSDHNPDWSAGGVVRAIDVDSNLEGGASIAEGQVLADAIIRAAREGDKRLSYVIFNRKIASGTYAATFWTWRPYTGSDPHTNHLHVSFTPAGDKDGSPFDLKISGTQDTEEADMDDYLAGVAAAKAAYEKDGKIGDPPAGKPKFWRAGWNELRWLSNNLRGPAGPRGPKGADGAQGLPGSTHTHTKISVAGPAEPSPS